MKKISFVVALVVSALVIGCQDNSNFSPVGPDASHSATTPLVKPMSNPDGVLQLEGEIVYGNAESLDNLFDLSGTVQYTLTQMDGDQYNLALVTDASFQSKGPKAAGGKVTGESIETVNLPNKQEVTIKKEFSVSGFEQEIEMHIVFVVSPEQVKIESIYLAAPSPRLARFQ